MQLNTGQTAFPVNLIWDLTVFYEIPDDIICDGWQPYTECKFNSKQHEAAQKQVIAGYKQAKSTSKRAQKHLKLSLNAS